MVAGDIIDLRVATLQRALDRARAATLVVEGLDPTLQQRLADRVVRRIDEVCADLADIDRDDAATFNRRIGAGDELIEETLAFLAAAGARRIGLDCGVTNLVMNWLDRLSDIAELPKVAVVIPAVAEFTGMVSSVVRLRVPLDGVWGLPVAVHEYGHFVAANLTRRQKVEATVRTVTPVEDVLHRAATSAELPQLYSHGHELFADAFAAATAGPAYSHYCLRYRFVPSAAQEETDTHPPAVRRVRVQLAVLGMLADADPSDYLAADVSALRERWNAELAAAGVSAEVPTYRELDQLESDIVSLVLEEQKLRRLRYSDHLSAYALAEAELSATGRPTVAQIINAAWTARAKIERDVEDAERVTSMLTDVAERTSALLERVMTDG